VTADAPAAGGDPTSRIVDLRADPDTPLDEVAVHLRAGGVIAYPTETVYGLGSACVPSGVSRVRDLKRREPEKPLIALVESAAAIADLVWSDAARELARIFWPGAVTLVLADPGRIFPPGVRDDKTGAVGVRVSPHALVVRLLDELGGPITSTSLNAPGGPPAASGREAARLVRELDGHHVWVLDAGTLPPSGPSTVVDCTGAEPVVIREGAVPVGRLRCAIPEIHERSI
jgi:L-threonylcarbamoyladenylate synthase